MQEVYLHLQALEAQGPENGCHERYHVDYIAVSSMVESGMFVGKVS